MNPLAKRRDDLCPGMRLHLVLRRGLRGRRTRAARDGIYYLIWVSVIRPSTRRHASPTGERARSRGPSVGCPRRKHDPGLASGGGLQAGDARLALRPDAQQTRQRRLRPSWRDRANQELAAKPLRDKFSELFGSMLVAAVFAALAALVAPVLLGVATNSGSMAVYLWLALVGTLGSWAILVPTKFSEGKLEDQGPIRVLLLLLGGLVGAAAWLRPTR